MIKKRENKKMMPTKTEAFKYNIIDVKEKEKENINLDIK